MSDTIDNNKERKTGMHSDNFLAKGFHELDEHLLDQNPPRITFEQGFYDKSDDAKLKYLVRLASTMNHASKLVSIERDELVKLLVLKDQQLEAQEESVRRNMEMLQSEVTRMNEQKQGFHAEVRRLNARIKELEDGDNS